MLRILLTFYKTFYLLTGGISLVALVFLWQSKTYASIIILFWMKTITNILIGFLFSTFNKEAFYFYNNLGLSSMKMYLGVFILDIFVWFFLSGLLLIVL